MELLEHLDKIETQFRAIIIDEAQDFGTTELKILRKLVRKQENDIFICGDGAQAIQAKQQSFVNADIDISTRSFRLEKNYRNSKEILTVATKYYLITAAEHIELSELEISDPKFATRSSAYPIVLKASF